MKIDLRYALVNGDVIDWESDDFPSVEAAQKTCQRVFNTPNATVSLNGPHQTQVISAAHVVSITIAPAATK